MYKLILAVIFTSSLAACAASGMKDLEKMADSGDSDAQYLIGYSFERGQNNRKDPGQAVKWYELASDNSHPRAQHRLGLMYAIGSGVQQDFSKVARLFESAAKQKYDAAQMDYAMFLYGMGPPEYKNEVEAYAWFIVIESNYPTAFASINDLKLKLEAQLSSEELIRAKNLGIEYVSKYSP